MKMVKTTNIDAFKTDDIVTELFEKNGIFHVKQYDYRLDAKIFRTMWETFQRYEEAKNFFNSQPGTITDTEH